MHIRRLILAVLPALCLATLAWWLLSSYEPVIPVQIDSSIPARFDGKQAMRYLHVLTHQYRGRVVGSEQGLAAADYVAGIFQSFGLQVEIQDFREAGALADGELRGWYEGRNVIGILPGQGTGAVVLTAHRDCVPKAPEGAYDNGSGTAVVMELARVMSEGGPHQYTYVFAALDGEEVGLAGARALMYTRPEVLEDIRLMINLDMVGLNETQGLGVTHAQYLPPKTRSLVAGHFGNPYYGLFQAPAGRGSDAQLFVWRGLPVLDFFDQLQYGTKYGHHNSRDTYEQISSDSIQLVGRIVERFILEGDATGAFVPASGLMISNSSGVLSVWRYRLGGFCILVIFCLPLIFRFRRVNYVGMPGWTMAALVLLAGIFTAVSALWSGSAVFALFPILGGFAFLVLMAVALRRGKDADSELGRLLLTAVPALLFAGTWFLLGFWSLALWVAAIAYVPAVLVAWKSGRAWRVFDTAMILPMLLLTWGLGMGAWLLAPLHAFPAEKLPIFAALYTTAALIGIWGIFGRRPSARALTDVIDSDI